jgi:predicted nucleic acid-binding protein
MAHCYLDTSALVKYYVAEIGTQWVRALIEERDNGQWANVISTSALTWAEAISAFSRHRRSKIISERLYAALIARFLRDGRSRYTRLPAGDAIINLAVELIQRHPLRAYDAVQLATALRLNRVLQDNRLPPLTFVSADGVLCDAARAEGVSAENPNDHP